MVSTPRCGRGNRSSNLRQGTVLFFFFFCYSVESTVHTPTLVSETQPLRLLRLRGSDFSHLPWRRSHGGGRMVQKVEFPGPRPLPAGGLRDGTMTAIIMIADATRGDVAIRHRHYSVTWSHDCHNETMCGRPNATTPGAVATARATQANMTCKKKNSSVYCPRTKP